MPPIDLDKLLCSVGKKYGLPKLYLKAVATVESSLNPQAYRFEPAFWEKYLKNHEFWKTWDPAKVSASFGLFQVIFVTAYEAGFVGQPEDLYNPVFNAHIAGKILSKHLERVEKSGVHIKWKIWPLYLCTARFNGGAGGNPDANGVVRNAAYADKVFKTWAELWSKEVECVEP